MTPMTTDERTLTELDHTRLRRLLAAAHAAAPRLSEMQEMLDSSDVVPSVEIPPTFVTMNTRVVLEEADGTRREITLCYPQDAEPSRGHVSVLSPAGAALLGLQAGQHARWHAPGGNERSARVVAIAFQPEASGDYLR